MRAVAYQYSKVITEPDALLDIELPAPAQPAGYDMLVAIKAISVNPVDTKIRKRAQPETGQYKVLGWDAAGVVVAVGEQVAGFQVGDEVYYAGDLTRTGTNAELHVVDSRIVALKPKRLSMEQAAALPLTAITAWEALFDRLKIQQPAAGAASSILVIGGAGGVGSIAIQLLAALTGLQIIATASRPESREWCLKHGAHVVLNHRESLSSQWKSLDLPAPAFVFSTTNSDDHLADIAELIAPQGRFALIDDPERLDISVFKRKSVSIHWEFMFTRSMFNTADIAAQGKLLSEIAELVDAGKIESTLAQHFGSINADNLKQAHALLESGHSMGKIVLSGFDAVHA